MSVATHQGNISIQNNAVGHAVVRSANPRAEMHHRLPSFVQPFLTWLTARPAPGETARSHSAHYHVITAFAALVIGVALSLAALELGRAWCMALPFLLIVSTSGMGKLQAVVFHHCAH